MPRRRPRRPVSSANVRISTSKTPPKATRRRTRRMPAPRRTPANFLQIRRSNCHGRRQPAAGQQQRTSWSIQRVQLTDETGAYVAAGGGGGGGAATIADGADVTQGAKADPQATSFDTTPWSVISLLKGI